MAEPVITIMPPAWLNHPDLQQLHRAVSAQNGTICVVGGAVRDWLRGVGAGVTSMPNDIDMATDLLPDTVLKIAEKLGIRAIPTGIEHGTITLLLAGKQVEVTTLRRDIICHGRHATVVFGRSYEEDAKRRDFTMNALYLSLDGVVHDYVGGLEDAQHNCLRFIGQAGKRIEEDALRILRFYRFIAQLEIQDIHPEAQAACQEYVAMIQHLSGERVQKELLKLLAAEKPQLALQAMQQAGVFTQIFAVPAYLDAAWLAKINHPLLRLRLLLRHADAAQLQQATVRLRLSREDARYLLQLQPDDTPSLQDTLLAHKQFVRRYGKSFYADAMLLKAAYTQLAPGDAALADIMQQMHDWPLPEFPVKAADLLAMGYQPGKKLGDCLRRLEARWEQSDYQLTRDALLQAEGLPQI